MLSNRRANDMFEPMGELRAPVGTVVLVEDDQISATLTRSVLEKEGYDVVVCGDAASGLVALSASLPDVVCTDLKLPDRDGVELVQQMRTLYARLPIIVLSSADQTDTVVAAIKAGAYDYLTKPFDRNKLLTTVRNAVEHHSMAVRVAQLTRENAGAAYPGIIGASPAMKALFRELDQVAPTDITVLLRGESGTGKELVAQAIHSHSGRRTNKFIAVNCAAIPESLHEAELFGYEKGAFTGAAQRTAGRFEQAQGGTLFLDEVGELSPSLQAKLLRVLQERRFFRVGGSTEVSVDIRIIAASHRDLAELVSRNLFREDLFFRLAVFELELPPLRARAGDIALLAQAFVARYSQELQKALALDETTLAVLAGYGWPGNVREMQNALHRAAVATPDGHIAPHHLPMRVVRAATAPGLTDGASVSFERSACQSDAPPVAPVASGTVPGLSNLAGAAPAGALDLPHDPPTATRAQPASPTLARPSSPALDSELANFDLDDVERATIVTAVARFDGNLTRVARELGIGRTTLYRKLRKYQLA